ncbi:MAG: S41 family peptidase [Nitrospirota bacterium]
MRRGSTPLSRTTFSASAVQHCPFKTSPLSVPRSEALVLDLRDSPGGLFDQAIDRSDQFMRKGALVATLGGR